MIDERFVATSHRFDPPPDAFERLQRRRDRKRRNQRIAAGVVGIAVFVAAVWIVTSLSSLDRSETSVVPGGDVTGPAETGPAETGPAKPIGPVPETDYLFDLDTGEMTPLPEGIVAAESPWARYAVSPDSSRLAYAGPDGNGSTQIFVANIDGTGVEQVTSEDRATEPAWSPDGSTIAYIGRRGDEPDNVFVLDLATGRSTQLTFETGDSGPFAPAFSPDGSSIVYSIYSMWRGAEDNRSQIRTVSIAGGESVVLVDDYQLSNPELSPDGSLLSYGCGAHPSAVSDICLANADGTDARVLVEALDAINNPRLSPDGTRIAYWEFHGYDVYIVDVATGERTYVAEGAFSAWLDDHTLIVKIDRCYDPTTGGRGGTGCKG